MVKVWQQKLKKEQYFILQFEGATHCGGKGGEAAGALVARTQGHWSHPCVRSWEAERDKCWFFLSFLTFIQYWIPVYKIQGDSLLLSDTPLETHPQTLPDTILFEAIL